MIVPPDLTLLSIAPVLTILITAMVALLTSLTMEDKRAAGGLALAGLAVAAVFAAVLLVDARTRPASAFGLQWIADGPAMALSLVILLGAALAILVGFDRLAETGLDQPEYYPLLLLSTAGALVMVHAGDLIVLLLGLEILSLPVYVLSAWRVADRSSEEAGMKYFLLGAFASAFLVYGIAMTYGATGAFDYGGIAAALSEGVGVLMLLGGALVVVGLGFKGSLAPFHQWAPDAYTGAPTPVTTFMSVVVKTAAFGALVRVFATAWPEALPELDAVLAVLIALTLVLGNFAALLQSSVKRMLAYSAVAHAGYLGMAVLAAGTGTVATGALVAGDAIAGDVGTRAIAWYLLAYTVMNAGAFAVLSLVADARDRHDSVEAWEGLGRRRPRLAIAMTIFLLSLAGIPPLAGFTGKLLVFQAAIQTGWIWLAVLGILTSVVAVVYYFRLVNAMWFRDGGEGRAVGRSTSTSWAIGLALAGTVALGLFPNVWYGLLEGGRQLLVAGL